MIHANYTSGCEAFGLTAKIVEEIIQRQACSPQEVFQKLEEDVEEFCQSQLGLQPHTISEMLEKLWLPLAMKLAWHRQQISRPFIQGILGGQGTGKTTTCKAVCLILQNLGYHSLSLSLDDLYKTYSDRLQLQQQDPRLIWRGPPGTHDVELGIAILDKIRHQEFPVAVPRFDKSAHNGAGERTTPEIVSQVDILLFEGWFVGVRPIDPVAFENAPPPIVTAADKAFARDMNQKLHDYLPLWQKLDSLILFYPQDYHLCLQWRQQAEKQAIAAGKAGMTDTQVEQFVKYFWLSLHPELFIKPLATSPELVDLVVEINSDHTIGRVYQLKNNC